MDEKFNFELPGLEERKMMIKLFMEQYVIGPSKNDKTIVIDPKINESFNDKVARNTQGFSGRQLAKVSHYTYTVLYKFAVCIIWIWEQNFVSRFSGKHIELAFIARKKSGINQYFSIFFH